MQNSRLRERQVFSAILRFGDPGRQNKRAASFRFLCHGESIRGWKTRVFLKVCEPLFSETAWWRGAWSVVSLNKAGAGWRGELRVSGGAGGNISKKFFSHVRKSFFRLGLVWTMCGRRLVR